MILETDLKKCNLPVEEYNAMKELMILQREKTIVIKAFDKGAGIIISNYSDYMKACYSHLTSFQTENRPYYTQLDDFEVERVKNKVRIVPKEALEN